MKFSEQKPTVPGAYWWKGSRMDRAWVTEIGIIDGVLSHIGSGVPVSEMSGEWSSRLVPSDESEAYQEGYQHAFDEIVHSRARVQELEALIKNPTALWAGILRGEIELPAGIGDLRQYQDRVQDLQAKVQRLTEAGDEMEQIHCRYGNEKWRKAKEGE